MAVGSEEGGHDEEQWTQCDGGHEQEDPGEQVNTDRILSNRFGAH